MDAKLDSTPDSALCRDDFTLETHFHSLPGAFEAGFQFRTPIYVKGFCFPTCVS